MPPNASARPSTSMAARRSSTSPPPACAIRSACASSTTSPAPGACERPAMSAAAGLAESRPVAGWYGKLAGLGDFAQRRLPPEWVGACDHWLSGAMRGAREQLGVRWLDIYLTAPVLRFAWAPGVVDPQWWFGVLMPSCDSVGRYFPLT